MVTHNPKHKCGCAKQQRDCGEEGEQLSSQALAFAGAEESTTDEHRLTRIKAIICVHLWFQIPRRGPAFRTAVRRGAEVVAAVQPRINRRGAESAEQDT